MKRIATALALVVAISGTGIAQGPEVTWPDAVARLTGERSKAEICAAMLKRYGNTAQISRARMDYNLAKADFDQVIEGLITALSESDHPDSLSNLEAKLDQGATALAGFCTTAAGLLPTTAGRHKGVVEDLVKEAIEPIIKSLSDGIAAIYTNYRNDKAAIRLSIKTQLESAKWPDFDKVKPAQ
jgi:hypothetical protein